MTSPDCVSAGLGIDVIEAEDVPNVRDLFDKWFSEDGLYRGAIKRNRFGAYVYTDTASAFDAFQAGYRAAGGQGA